MILGLRPRDVISLARETQQTPDRSPIVVSGPRAQEIVDWLTRDGDRSLVRVGGGPEGSSAYVVTVAGPLDAAEEGRLRVAARAGISLIAVRLTADDVEIPYVLPGDVVDVDSHDGSLAFDRLAETLAAALGGDGAALASGLPGLRPSVERRRIADAALAAASLTAFTRAGSRPLLPVLALAQARTLRELAIARGDTAPSTPAATAAAVGPELGAALAVGLVCRTLVRRLPVRGRLVEGVVAGFGTYALALAARRLPRL